MVRRARRVHRPGHQRADDPVRATVLRRGLGCGNSNGNSEGAGDDDGGPGNGVQVLSASVVGPYDTVTLKSSNPTALVVVRLNANQYDIPSSTDPIIQAYVSAGFDFIALRLAPGEGVQAMQPVRVTTPGAWPRRCRSAWSTPAWART